MVALRLLPFPNPFLQTSCHAGGFFSCKPPQCRMHRRELCTPKGKERANAAVMQIYKYLTAFSSDSPEEVVVMWSQRRLHYHFVFFVKFNRRATCRISNILRNICPFQLSETESSLISRVQSQPALKCCLSCRRRSRRCWRRHLPGWHRRSLWPCLLRTAKRGVKSTYLRRPSLGRSSDKVLHFRLNKDAFANSFTSPRKPDSGHFR